MNSMLKPAEAITTLTPYLGRHIVSVRNGKELPFVVGSKKKIYIVTSGRAKWTLSGIEVTVDAPAVFGHVQFFTADPIASAPPYSEISGWVIDGSAEIAEVDWKLFVDGKAEPETYNALRVLACAAKWDPYLAMLSKGAPPFKSLKQPYEGGIEYPNLSLRRKSARNWTTVLSQFDTPAGISLVCNGFLKSSVSIERGDEPFGITAWRAPALIGEFERPIPFHADPIPAGVTVEVLADEDSGCEEFVFLIDMLYEQYAQFCAASPNLEIEMIQEVRKRTLQWVPKLGYGRGSLINFGLFVLQEWQHLGEPLRVTVPKKYFDEFLGGDSETLTKKPPATARNPTPLSTVEKLSKAGCLEVEFRDGSVTFSGIDAQKLWETVKKGRLPNQTIQQTQGIEEKPPILA